MVIAQVNPDASGSGAVVEHSVIILRLKVLYQQPTPLAPIPNNKLQFLPLASLSILV
jgi:hypothetical protein